MDTLLISPASVRQVVLGKALAGLFYVLTAVLAAFVFNWTFVVNWGLAIVAVLCGALLSVGLGLMLGIFFENKPLLNTWVMILLQPLLIPVFLSMIDPILPEALRTALPWVPTVALSMLFRISLTSGATLAQVMTHLGVVLASVVLVLAVVVWKVRRVDR